METPPRRRPEPGWQPLRPQAPNTMTSLIDLGSIKQSTHRQWKSQNGAQPASTIRRTPHRRGVRLFCYNHKHSDLNLDSTFLACENAHKEVDRMRIHRLNIWKIAGLLLGAVLIVCLYNHVINSDQDTYTVRLYRTYWNEEDGFEVTRSIVPQKVADFAYGSHDAKPERALFDGAEVHCGSSYGPSSLQGVFAASDVNVLFGREVLAQDWAFSISVFKTSQDKILNYYLSIELPWDPEGEAVATLMVFYDGHSMPTVYTWTGALGERIGFGIEV